MPVRQISRQPPRDRRQAKPAARRTPKLSESAAPPKQTQQERLDEDLSGAKHWAKISASCARCEAVHVHCVNTGAEVCTPCLCPSGSCSWIPRALAVDVGRFPWLVDMPGCFGPGDVFEADQGDRVFHGGKRFAGHRSIRKGGRFAVTNYGALKRL